MARRSRNPLAPLTAISEVHEAATALIEAVERAASAYATCAWVAGSGRVGGASALPAN